jgi:uncharacterized membrane protein
MFRGLTAIPLDQRLRGSGPGEEAAASSRCSVCPLWSLIGTFKVALTSLVDVDTAEGVIKWHQRSPKGGFISMRLSMALVTDVSLARLALEDKAQAVTETQFSVVIKMASGKPSQVVFGFPSQGAAARLRALLK